MNQMSSEISDLAYPDVLLSRKNPGFKTQPKEHLSRLWTKHLACTSLGSRDKRVLEPDL